MAHCYNLRSSSQSSIPVEKKTWWTKSSTPEKEKTWWDKEMFQRCISCNKEFSVQDGQYKDHRLHVCPMEPGEIDPILLNNSNDLREQTGASHSQTQDETGYLWSQGPSKSRDDQHFLHSKFSFLKSDQLKDKSKRSPKNKFYDPSTLFVPQTFLERRTPAHRQWWEKKIDNFDTILFFKIGKFYELFHMDAIIAKTECNLLLKNQCYASCSFPVPAVDHYAKMLFERGFKTLRMEYVRVPNVVSEITTTMEIAKATPPLTFEAPTSTFEDEAPTTSFGAPAARFEAPTAIFEAPTARFEPPTARFEPPTASFEAPKTRMTTRMAALETVPKVETAQKNLKRKPIGRPPKSTKGAMSSAERQRNSRDGQKEFLELACPSCGFIICTRKDYAKAMIENCNQITKKYTEKELDSFIEILISVAKRHSKNKVFFKSHDEIKLHGSNKVRRLKERFQEN